MTDLRASAMLGHMTNDDDLNRLLHFDPLNAAGRITGKDYKEDRGTSSLGFALLVEAGKAKKEALQERGDTHFNSDLEEQLHIMEQMGFKEVLLDTFVADENREETFRILWNNVGVLATVESYMGTRRNSAKMYYNQLVYPTHIDDHWENRGSGRFSVYDEDEGMYLWVGDIDVREAVKHKFNTLFKQGITLPVWEERPFLWLVNYGETKVKGYDYNAINEERISRLPDYVRKAITPDVQG